MAQIIEITDVRDNAKYNLLFPNEATLKLAEEDIRASQEMSEEYMGGIVTAVAVRECTRKDETKTTFSMIDLQVTSKGKNFRKSYSVDFLRKYLNQLGVKAENLFGAAVMFKTKDKFKNISYLAVIGTNKNDDQSDIVFVTIPYVDEADQDVLKKLKDLGL